MKPKEAIKYFTGFDHFADSLQRENAILAPHTGREQHNLPFDAGPIVALRVYKERVREMAVLPIVIVGRITGIDAVHRAVKARRGEAEL